MPVRYPGEDGYHGPTRPHTALRVAVALSACSLVLSMAGVSKAQHRAPAEASVATSAAEARPFTASTYYIAQLYPALARSPSSPGSRCCEPDAAAGATAKSARWLRGGDDVAAPADCPTSLCADCAQAEVSVQRATLASVALFVLGALAGWQRATIGGNTSTARLVCCAAGAATYMALHVVCQQFTSPCFGDEAAGTRLGHGSAAWTLVVAASAVQTMATLAHFLVPATAPCRMEHALRTVDARPLVTGKFAPAVLHGGPSMHRVVSPWHPQYATGDFIAAPSRPHSHGARTAGPAAAAWLGAQPASWRRHLLRAEFAASDGDVDQAGEEATPPQEPEESPPKDAKALKAKIKEKGIAGIISLLVVRVAWLALSLPLAAYAYYQATGSMPNPFDQAQLAQVMAYSAGYVGMSSALLPLRLALSFGLIPFFEKLITLVFGKKKKDPKEGEQDAAAP